MPGGLLNLVAYGASNIVLNGNPTKTFFKATYQKYTNFGLQRFRVDYRGQRTLSFDTETVMQFKIPRYADLLWDTYVVVNLPDIWSPLFPRPDLRGGFVPYEFRWTRDLGTNMIQGVTIHSGGTTLANYSGEWISCAIQRDETGRKKLWNRMVGNIPELYDPANALGRDGVYPNALYTDPTPGIPGTGSDALGIEPSIRGRQLYIPLLAWFCDSSRLALPLVALQYQEIFIKIRFRPVRELFTVLNVAKIPDLPRGPISISGAPLDWNRYEYHYCEQQLEPNVGGRDSECGFWDRTAPLDRDARQQMWLFLQPPPAQPITQDGLFVDYRNRRQDWDADIHLLCVYVFLGNEERRQFAARDHHYLVKMQYSYDFQNATGSRRVRMGSRNMVSSYMFRFRRSDAYLRNEWSNYSNWPYEGVLPAPPAIPTASSGIVTPSDYWISGPMEQANISNILLDLGILMGPEYRENVLPVGVYNLVDKWKRSNGAARAGLYLYCFCLNSDRTCYQPSGAQNMNRCDWTWFEYNTIEPPIDPLTSQVEVLCDPSGAIIGLRKDVWRLNEYNFDLRVFEERYNVIVITSGCIGVQEAR